MAPLLRVIPLTAALLVAATACEDDTGTVSSTRGGTQQEAEVIAEDARMAWAADIEADWDATDAVEVGGWVLVATKWNLEEDSSVIGLDSDDGEQWWATQSPGYGTIELTVLDDGTVQACDNLGGDVLDPTIGQPVREATAEECPEDFEGEDPSEGDVYEVEDSQLVVYDDVEHSNELYRITLRDSDAEAWAVDGGVVTYSPSAHEVRLYR
jgi:hypothetical protein